MKESPGFQKKMAENVPSQHISFSGTVFLLFSAGTVAVRISYLLLSSGIKDNLALSTRISLRVSQAHGYIISWRMSLNRFSYGAVDGISNPLIWANSDSAVLKIQNRPRQKVEVKFLASYLS